MASEQNKLKVKETAERNKLLEKIKSQPLLENELEYILQELALLVGCIPAGLGFFEPEQGKISHGTKQPLFIIYPNGDDRVFAQAKKQLESFDTSKFKYLFDVNCMEV